MVSSILQKSNDENWPTTTVPQVNCFCSFFGRMENTKRHFEIKWILSLLNVIKKFWYINWCFCNQWTNCFIQKSFETFSLQWWKIYHGLGATIFRSNIKKNAKMQEATNAFSWHSAWVIFKYLHFLLSYNYIDRNLILKYIYTL